MKFIHALSWSIFTISKFLYFRLTLYFVCRLIYEISNKIESRSSQQCLQRIQPLYSVETMNTEVKLPSKPPTRTIQNTPLQHNV